MCFPALQKAATFVSERRCPSALTGRMFTDATALSVFMDQSQLNDKKPAEVFFRETSSHTKCWGTDERIQMTLCCICVMWLLTMKVLLWERWIRCIYVICRDIQLTLHGWKNVVAREARSSPFWQTTTGPYFSKTYVQCSTRASL